MQTNVTQIAINLLKKRNFVYLMICLLTTFLFPFLWHFYNNAIPIWDGADYVLSIQKILKTFEVSFYDGFKSVFFERGWRPILFPQLALPFFIFSRGDINTGVALTQSFYFLLISFFSFKFFNIYLSVFKSFLGVFILVTTGYILNYSTMFYSELAWISMMIIGLYYYKTKNKNEKLSIFMIGLSLGIMFCIRPVETALILFLPILFLVYFEYKKLNLLKVDIIYFMIAVFAISCLFLYRIFFYEYKFLSLLFFLIFFLSITLIFKQFKRKPKFIHSLLLSLIISFIWHYPTANILYHWVYETSIGDLAKLSDQRYSSFNIIEIFASLFMKYSPFTFMVLILCSLISYFFSFSNSPSNKKAYTAAIQLIFFSFLMIFPILLALFFTGTSDMRRPLPAFVILEIGFILFILCSKSRLLNFTILIFLFLIQILNFISSINPVFNENFKNYKHYLGNINSPFIFDDPNELVLSNLNGIDLNNKNVLTYSFCYRDWETCINKGFPFFEQIALTTLSNQKNINTKFLIDRNLDLDNNFKLLKEIKDRQYDYILLDSFKGSDNLNFDDPYNTHVKYFIDMIHDNKEGIYKKIYCFDLNREICLYEILSSRYSHD
jgi:hypothetical protein